MSTYIFIYRPDLPVLPDLVSDSDTVTFEQTPAERAWGRPPKEVDPEELVRLGYCVEVEDCPTCHGKGYLP